MSTSGARGAITVVFEHADGTWPKRPTGWSMVVWKGPDEPTIGSGWALVDVDEYEQITTVPSS